MTAAWLYLQSKVDPSINREETTWVNLRKSNKLTIQFLESHSKTDRYHMVFYKCNDANCVCGQVRMPLAVWQDITKRPCILPFPTPDPKDEGKYLNYEDVKRIPTFPIHRPSLVTLSQPAKSNTEAADIDKAMKKDGKSLFHPGWVRAVVECNDCGKRRCVYAYPSLGASFVQCVADLVAVMQEPGYEYVCGGGLFGLASDPVPHPASTAIFHVRRNLSCALEIESHYYTSNVGLKAICCRCSSEHDHLSVDELETAAMSNKAGKRKARPLCRECYVNGLKPVLWGAT